MLDCTVGFFVVVGTSAPVRRRIGAPTADAKRWIVDSASSAFFLFSTATTTAATSTQYSVVIELYDSF